MPQHLLTCTCGRQIPVELSQAGEELRCTCGAAVSVPTFRQLRELPLAEVEPVKQVATHTWGARQGTIAASLIFAALLLLGAGISRYFEPVLPRFNPAAWNQSVSGEIDKLVPAEAWKIWTDNYRTLTHTGFTAMEHPATRAIREAIDQHRRIEFTLLGAAAFFGVVAGALWLIGSTTPN
jgi:hypothetical protein